MQKKKLKFIFGFDPYPPLLWAYFCLNIQALILAVLEGPFVMLEIELRFTMLEASALPDMS